MRFSFLIVFFCFNLNAVGQNLVPNPSFEDLDFCPYQINQIQAATGWMNFGGTPECLNSCNTMGLGVPSCNFGFQYPHSGNSMAGVISFRRPNSPDGPDYREFIAIPLITSLNIGQKYFLSFHINFAFTNFLAIATNKMGIRFSTGFFSQFVKPPINNIAHLYTDSIISDSLNWIKVSGSFVADSNYTNLILGNFFDDNNTATVNMGPFPDYAYNYIDDVCVSTDSLFNEVWTSVEDNIYPAIPHLVIYPNPTMGLVYFNSSFDLTVYSSSWQRLVFFSNCTQIDLSCYESGVYYFQLEKNGHLIYRIVHLNY